MYKIPLLPIPNQAFSVRFDDTYFDLILKEVRGVMSLTVSRGGELVIAGVRCVPFEPLIPYVYLEGAAGNLCFVTQGEYPHYTRFGGTDALYYATAAELAEARGAQ